MCQMSMCASAHDDSVHDEMLNRPNVEILAEKSTQPNSFALYRPIW